MKSFVLALLLLPLCLGTAFDVQAEGVSTEKKEVSDLDRPLEDLSTAVCEHKKKTYQCDECRYEVGFVHTPAELFADGLMSSVQPVVRQASAFLSLTGEIRFDELKSVQVSPQTDGVVKAVRAVLGQKVVKGQPLLEIESTAVGDDQAALAEAQSLLALAKRNHDRAELLYKENIASQKNYQQAKQELEAARIRVLGVQSRLSRLGSDSQSKGRIVLRAPLDGTVLALRAVPGELTRAGDMLATVGDDSSMVMWADIYERDIPAVKAAQANGAKPEASVSVKAYPGEEFSGVLEFVSPSLNESSRTLKARILVENPGSRLLAGMFATVKLSLSDSGETLLLPREAVLSDEGESFVFVRYDKDYFVRRKIEPGQIFGDTIEIRKGLEPAQVVAAQGAFLMKSDVLRSKMGAGCAD